MSNTEKIVNEILDGSPDWRDICASTEPWRPLPPALRRNLDALPPKYVHANALRPGRIRSKLPNYELRDCLVAALISFGIMGVLTALFYVGMWMGAR